MTRTGSAPPRLRTTAAWLVLAVAALAGCSRTAVDSRVEPSPAPSPAAATRSGPVGSDSAVSCVEEYAPTAVAGRGFAFDGTVTAIGESVSDRGDEADLGQPGVTFTVHEWFRGGSGDSVTVDLAAPGGFAGRGKDYELGTRLLVSGEPRWGGEALERPIAWSCGFTRYHDVETATAWREAVAGRSR